MPLFKSIRKTCWAIALIAASQSLAAEDAKPAAAESTAKPTATKALTKSAATKKKSKAKKVFIVQDGMDLSQISLLLYGTDSRWVELATFNHLKRPYRLFVGQKLKLKSAPTIKKTEGRQKLVERWRKHFDYVSQSAADAGAAVVTTQTDAAATAEAAPPVDGAPTADAPPEIVVQAPPVLPPPTPAKLEAVLKEHEERLKETEKPESRSAEEVFNAGKLLFEKNEFKPARELFKKSRTVDPKQVPSWIFEMRSLKSLINQGELTSDAELKEVADAFVVSNPELKDLPVLKNILAPAASKAAPQ